jgi:photosystem II stability/assembly factor-like uncharacterized protein
MFLKQLSPAGAIAMTGLLLFVQNLLHAQGWQWQNPLPQGNRLDEIQFVDSLYGWIRAEGHTILRTTDGGQTWSEEIIGNDPQQIYFQKIFFVNQLNGWAVGSGAPPFILHTSNGGKTWENLPIPAERNTGNYYNFRDVFFLDTLKGFFTDDFSGIFHTRDGGQTWEEQATGLRPGREIRSIFFVDSLKGFAVGATPLLYTKDGGRIWLHDSTIVGGFKVSFVDSLHGWIFNPNGISRTEDGGRMWTNMQFVDRFHGWAVGVRGDITHTIDGGETWMIQQSKTILTLSDIDFVNERTGWAAGIFGTILHTETGGVTYVAEPPNISSPPSGFELYQNYPNPFNVQTVLSFRLYYSQTKVTVAIYNLMGELVTTLLNDRMAAGYHRVIWNGADQYGKSVGSGVYLYQIKAGDQQKGGKMILLK